MQELSLNILDIAQNSLAAGAKNIALTLDISTLHRTLTLRIEDDGAGMPPQVLARAADPFFTSRTTRSVGLGLPFLKQLAQLTGGNFTITSAQGKGTTVQAVFTLGHIDLPPLGDMPASIVALVQSNPEIDFVYTLRADGEEFTLATTQLREILGDVSLGEAQVAVFLQEYLTENTRELQNRSIVL